MNDKVAKTMLYLCSGFLFAFYIIKFFFPSLLLQTISSPTLIALGEFISIWKGFEYIVTSITLFITFYLFACASCGRIKLKWWQIIIILGFVAIESLVFDFLPNLYTHTSISLMLILALICKGKLLNTTISFVLHGYLSNFLTSIRGFETVIMYINPISGLLINLEGLLWLLLLAIIFYIKEQKDKGKVSSAICKQTSGQT